MVPLSLLDNAPVPQGTAHAAALMNTVTLARKAEALGFCRFWVGEHHLSPTFASATPTVMLAHLAAVTSSIRLGSGGVMLHNHAPLVVAEQFRTLAALCPDRLDLGLGRTGCRDGSMPPSVALSMQARGTFDPLGNFDFALEELASYLQGTMAGQEGVEGTTAVDNLPIWILASSMPGVACALYNGLPLAIRPTTSLEDLRLLVRTYKSMFKPSSPEARARAMVNVDCFAAETDEEAHYLSTSMKQMVCNGIRNQQSGLPPPVRDVEATFTAEEAEAVAKRMAFTLVGGPESLRRQINELIEATGADELIVSVWAHDPEARLRGLEVLAQAGGLSPRA